jgi:mannitol-1-phosphate 5-dehydrogenase
MNKSVLIYGAGAIGRGFLAPLLQKYDYKISFVDNDKELITELKSRNYYRAAITGTDNYDFVDVSVANSFFPDEEKNIEQFDLVFSCVGPANCYDLSDDFKRAKTLISCENDMSTVKGLQDLSGNQNIYFGIPDVITSNTAPPELLKHDPLMTVTEKGVLVLERGNYQLPDEILQVEYKDLHMHWMCKLFIHNAPHAIIAYLGWMKGYIYIHEAMADKDINEVVMCSIGEITDGVIASCLAKKEYATYYKEKELKRFSNKLLYDPIERVAREPLRKIAKNNRLVLALRIALFNGVQPENTAKGLKAALYYNNTTDEEAVYFQKLRETVKDSELLEKFSGIDQLDPLNGFITQQTLSPFQKNNYDK